MLRKHKHRIPNLENWYIAYCVDADFRHDENEFRLTFSMFNVLLGQHVHRDVDTAVARAAANS